MNEAMQNYYNITRMPWTKLYYRMVEQQLTEVKGKKVLDFGSGFCILANRLAENNEVFAMEPNVDMKEYRDHDNNYIHITGGYEQLKEFSNETFDVIVCHNVLEYAKERREIVDEFARLLKKGGMLSVVKHNHAGRVMQKVVFENNIDEAISILEGGEASTQSFGTISYYDDEAIIEWNDSFHLEEVLGVRTFWGLQQNNEPKKESNWQEKMLEVEMKVSKMKEYRNIAFFHHLLMRKL